MRAVAAVAAAGLAIVLSGSVSGCARHDNAERSALHLPVYPHANAVSVPPQIRAKNAGHVIEVFTTWDSFDKVRDWYAAMLPKSTQSVVNEVERQATFALFDDRRRSVHLEVSGNQVVIYLSGTDAAVTGR
ncbi:MAG TPA: hypothetical protein VKF82_10530 [Candidatus Eremiobacteraceae bacterium]|nr:hypothetical protein [Candidatus Eremiobacteraceae bacterium]